MTSEDAEVQNLLNLLGRAYNDAAKYGLPAKNRELWEEVWVTCAVSDEADTEVSPSQIFAAWVNRGPRLARAAGCHVGIKVTERNDNE